MRLWLVVTLFVCIGCASDREDIPIYSPMAAPQTLRLLQERSGQIQTVSAQGTLRLTRPDGQSIILDTAVALQPTDHARLRAWKFSQAVFDLTLIPQGVYIVAPKDSEQHQQIMAAGAGAAKMMRTWMQLVAGAFEPMTVEEREDALIITQKQSDGLTLVCTVDRRTITPRLYRLLDDKGAVRFVLALSHYVQSNGQVWPRRMDASSDTGGLQLDLRDVEINAELAAGAFQPPRRAEKLP